MNVSFTMSATIAPVSDAPPVVSSVREQPQAQAKREAARYRKSIHKTPGILRPVVPRAIRVRRQWTHGAPHLSLCEWISGDHNRRPWSDIVVVPLLTTDLATLTRFWQCAPSFPSPDIPAVVDKALPHMFASTAGVVVNILRARLAMLEHWLHCDTTPPHIRYDIVLWIHAHLPLVYALDAYMDDYADMTPTSRAELDARDLCADDEALLSGGDATRTMIERVSGAQVATYFAPPSVVDVMCEDTLPVLTPFLPVDSLWGAVYATVIPIKHMFWKSMPRRCRIRNLVKMLFSRATTDPSVIPIMVWLFACSILGLYRHSQRSPLTLAARRRIHDAIFCSPQQSPHELLQWFCELGQNIMFFVLKEATVFTLRKTPDLYGMVLACTQWMQYEERVCSGLDDVRRLINNNVMRGEPRPFTGVEATLAAFNVNQIGTSFRTSQHTFLNAMRVACTRLYMSIVAAYLRGSADAPTFAQIYHIDPALARRLPDAATQLPLLDADTIARAAQFQLFLMLMATCIRRHNPWDTVRLEWLALFGCSESAMVIVRKLFAMHCESDIKNRADAPIRTLARISLADFMLIRTYFVVVDDLVSIRLFPMTRECCVAQHRALRSMHSVPDNVPDLPASAGRIVICPCCYSIKNNVVRRAYHPRFALGVNNTYTHPHTMARTCRRPQLRATPKRRRTVTADDQCRQAARQLCKRDSVQCRETEVVEINLIGKWLQFFDQLLFLCPTCGAIAEYQPYHMRGTLPLCAACHIEDGKCPWEARNRSCTEVRCDFCDSSQTMAAAERMHWQHVRIRAMPLSELHQAPYDLDKLYYAVPCSRFLARLRDIDTNVVDVTAPYERTTKYDDQVHPVWDLYMCNDHWPSAIRSALAATRERAGVVKGDNIVNIGHLCIALEYHCTRAYRKRMRI